MKNVFVHEKALCDSEAIGEGTRIWAFAHVLNGASIGKKCNIGEGVFVEGGVSIGDACTIKNGVCVWDLVTLEDGVFVGPNAVFTNDLRPRSFLKGTRKHWRPTLIQKGSTIGANATIVCGVTLGAYCMIGAGSVVTKDVPPHTLIVGNPGRAVGRVCFCGESLDSSDYCESCEKKLEAEDRGRASVLDC